MRWCDRLSQAPVGGSGPGLPVTDLAEGGPAREATRRWTGSDGAGGAGGTFPRPGRPVGAENPIRPGHATIRYSWIKPKTASLRCNFAGSGSPIGGGESIVDGAS